MPVMPLPINAGVFGIVRTIALCPFIQRDKSTARIPAAIDRGGLDSSPQLTGLHWPTQPGHGERVGRNQLRGLAAIARGIRVGHVVIGDLDRDLLRTQRPGSSFETEEGAGHADFAGPNANTGIEVGKKLES